MAAFGADGRCLMRALQEELDDPAPADCGRCSVCAGPRFDGEPDAELSRAAQAHLRSQPLTFEAKKMAPDAEGAMKKIPEDVRTADGIALARMGDAGWSREIESGLAAGRLSDEIVAAAADLARGGGASWVCAVPARRASSDGEEDVVSSFARRLASSLGVPFVGALARVEDRPPQSEMRNAHAQVTNVRGAFAVVADPPAGTCLLVDDRRFSGWTLAMTGGQLRSRGAGGVVPFALMSAF